MKYNSSEVAEMGDGFATIDMDRKLGGAAVPFSVRGAGSPSNTMSSGLRPTLARSGILIDPCNLLATICQRYKQDRQDSVPIAQTPQSGPIYVTVA